MVYRDRLKDTGVNTSNSTRYETDEARLCGLVEPYDPLWTKLYMCIDKRTKWTRIGNIQETMRENRFLSHIEALEQLAFENNMVNSVSHKLVS